MNRQQLNTRLTLRALGVPLRLLTFDDRLIIQKSIYLAQAAGHDCGHYYRWYLRGPYSPDLTRDAFGIQAEVEAGLDDSDQWMLDETAQQRLNRVKPLIPQDGDESVNAHTLELLASVHFLVAHKQVPTTDAGAIMELLKKYDKTFSKIEVEEALRGLQANGLLQK